VTGMDALDGNAIAGQLVVVFGKEMTTATGECGRCGRRGPVAEVAEQAIVIPDTHYGRVEDVQMTILTRFPGTPLYARLLAEGRILQPERWDLCTLFDVNYQPANMTVEELREGIYWLAERLYTDECLKERRQPFFENQWRNLFAQV